MNSKKSQIIQALSKFTVSNGKEVKQFLFTTSIGLIFGKLSYDTNQATNSNKVNLGFVLSDLYKKESLTLESMLENDYILLKDVSIFHNNRISDFSSYILFYENIIGISLTDIDSQNKLLK